MRIIEGTTEFKITEETAVAIGKFDGFHVGHQTLLKQVMAYKQQGLKTVIFTFFPSPSCLFSKEPVRELTTREEKRQLFRQAGVDILVEYPFTNETAAMLPDVFIKEILVGKLNAKWVVAGNDVSFGYRGAGDAELLKKMAQTYDYQVQIIDKVSLLGHEISSTYVREVISEGNMELARDLLGVPFHVSGIVSHGRHLGRTLGMPTANLYPEEEKLLPPFGVYYANVSIDGVWHKGICNIGRKPTVNEDKKVSVETYLYDFSENIYGKEITVALLKFKRPEQKFPDIEALKAQMKRDIAEGACYILEG